MRNGPRTTPSPSLEEARCFACEEGVPLVNLTADRPDLPDLWAHQYGGEPGTVASCLRTDRGTLREQPSLEAPHGTLGQLRELTADLADDTPIVVVTRKAHDPDYFYEPVLTESDPHVSLNGRPQIIFTAAEPGDFDV